MNVCEIYCPSAFLCYFPPIPLSFHADTRQRKGTWAALRAHTERFTYYCGDVGFTPSGRHCKGTEKRENAACGARQVCELCGVERVRRWHVPAPHQKREFPGGPVVRILRAFTAKDVGSIPGQEIKKKKRWHAKGQECCPEVMNTIQLCSNFLKEPLFFQYFK